jgi:hypothetical protein
MHKMARDLISEVVHIIGTDVREPKISVYSEIIIKVLRSFDSECQVLHFIK